ncbi:peptidylprolyl isomerase [Sphingomonas sp. CGMCC 1.13654]|uniref:Parvulin-like PPIase n=1 Tax=Sphingomonas chungangi TaxID=2683589 RepID=A0A838L9F4_9SPHN|nr:peptidylprolyl isomerase [Sphingomonas chungangi]MBA2935814.1 peptidylprolyl isomerase [Sphingomonas chungangi]MVW54505.1 peptidylprolyl isomerase [Sphingomonas chungangi]
MFKPRLAALCLAGALALIGPGHAFAQGDDDDTAVSNPLNLPNDVQMFGKFDPTIRKATAIVNGFIITDTDVDQRLNLVLAANGQQVSGDEKDRLRLQVLRNLIDETLEIQEAKSNDVTVPSSDIDSTFQRVAAQFKYTPDQFAAFLKSKGSSQASIKRQIEGEMAWQRLLDRKVQPFINVGDDEVKQVIARLNASKGAKEYHVGEIFISSTPATDAQAHENADKVFEQLKKGGSFVAYARQYSEASTAAVGGDLGWVRAEQLPDPIAQALPQMQNGSVTPPIQVSGGYSIIALQDTRQVLTSDPRDALLSLKQITISFPAGTTQETASPRVAAFADATQKMAGCGAAKDVAARFDGNMVENDNIKIRDLPPALQNQMTALSIGQSTTPFGSVEDGVRVLVLCGRDDPQTANAPSFDAIYNQMEQERVDLRARRYLRDLRRDAVIEYR